MLTRRLLWCFVIGFTCTSFAPTTSAGTFQASSNAEVRELKRKIQATQFLSRATFGPKPAEVQALADRIQQIGRKPAFAEWIEAQWQVSATSHRTTALEMIADDGFEPLTAGINRNRYKDHAWWHVAVNSDDQLRQRVAWALSQIFVINERGNGFGDDSIDGSGFPRYLGVTNYYDMLAANASTNYRTLLQDVSVHPCMGIFLSHFRNRKADASRGIFPDENYAREVMQLMTIGLYELRPTGQFRRSQGNLIDTYDNDDIKSFARVFTGMSYKVADGNFYGAPNLNEPMQAFEQFHDTDPKEVLRGETLPGGNTTIEDVTAGLDNIFAHPNVPPFVSRLLIQRLVKSNPSKGYIRRVGRIFKNNGSGVRGDMQAVVKAILLDREALNSLNYRRLRRPFRLQVTQKSLEGSKLREPVLAYTAMLRAFPITNSYPTGRLMMNNFSNDSNQSPYESPSVFNFYLPDYQPPGEITDYVGSRRLPNGTLFAPEFEIFNAVTANRMANRFRNDIRDASIRWNLLGSAGLENTITLDFSTEEGLAADPAALLSHLDMVLCHGSMSDASKQIIADAIDEETTDLTLRARSAILSVMTSSENMVTE